MTMVTNNQSVSGELRGTQALLKNMPAPGMFNILNIFHNFISTHVWHRQVTLKSLVQPFTATERYVHSIALLDVTSPTAHWGDTAVKPPIRLTLGILGIALT